jgi:hypothetical protein
MRFPDTITEEQRSEIFWAITERHKRLLALEESTVKQHAPADGVKRLLRTYGSGTILIKGEAVEVTGLISMFAPDPELPLEVIEGMDRKVDGPADLFGGGAETGGGIKAGGKDKWKGKHSGQPEKIGLAVEGVVGALSPEIVAQREAAREAESAARKRAGPVWIETPADSGTYVKHDSIPDDLPEGTIVLWQDPAATPDAGSNGAAPGVTDGSPQGMPGAPTESDDAAIDASAAHPRPGALPLQPDYSTSAPVEGDPL